MSTGGDGLKPTIRIENLCKSYRLGETELPVLKSISLQVMKGEYLAILGPSGSGKSTLMNVIGCMDRFQQGEYWLTDCSVGTMNDAQLTRLRNEKIGFIFQKYHLIQKYSVLLNTMLPLLIRGVPRKQAEELSTQKLSMLGMEARVDHKPNELSGGQQQRVAIARALVGTPELLLADEPTGALDRATGQEVLRLFEEMNAMGNTIVMITHDLSVAQHAKRIVHIIDGELFEDGQENAQAVSEVPKTLSNTPIQKGETHENQKISLEKTVLRGRCYTVGGRHFLPRTGGRGAAGINAGAAKSYDAGKHELHQ